MISDDLTALIFELQRAGSPADKAKVLARAWRTVRGLKPTERRLLAREVGFDGAEDLIEGLGGQKRGAFAPAAVLEALGKMRADPELSVRGVLADLRDPNRRDDLLMRGMDMVAESVAPEPEPEPELDIERFELPDGNVWMMDENASDLHDRAPKLDKEQVSGDRHENGVEVRSKAKPPRPPVPQAEARPEPEPRPESKPEPKPDPKPKPKPKPKPETKPVPTPEPVPKLQPKPLIEPLPEPKQPSPWETFDAHQERVDSNTFVAMPSLIREVSGSRSGGSVEQAEGSAILRLRALRQDIAGLGNASTNVLADRLDIFPEPWARRRALVALIEAGVPDDPAQALDLIEDLERPLDRRWCLAVLARRGDLTGDDLERALAMLASPAARRRVTGLAAG